MAYSDAAFLKAFGLWLQALRKRLQMTQVELGDLLGVRGEPVSRWENGVQTPTALTVARLLALATGQERDALFERAMLDVDDAIRENNRSGDRATMPVVRCAGCGKPMRLRQFAEAGWPAPARLRQPGDPYAVKVCPSCQGF